MFVRNLLFDLACVCLLLVSLSVLNNKMNAQNPCSFDWTDGLEKYPVYCRKGYGVIGKDSMVNFFVLNAFIGFEALAIYFFHFKLHTHLYTDVCTIIQH